METGPSRPTASWVVSRTIAGCAQAVRALQPGYREAVEGWLLAEREPGDAASNLGITKSCLRTRVARARQQLALRLPRAA